MEKGIEEGHGRDGLRPEQAFNRDWDDDDDDDKLIFLQSICLVKFLSRVTSITHLRHDVKSKFS